MVRTVGRISISGWIAMGAVRKKNRPAAVAPKCFQAHQRFVSLTAPKLAGALEATLVLSAGRFNGPTAQRFAAPRSFPIFHALKVRSKIVNLLLHRFTP